MWRYSSVETWDVVCRSLPLELWRMVTDFRVIRSSAAEGQAILIRTDEDPSLRRPIRG